ncbi:ABC transporter permease [Bacillus suaedae]|uniref:ABC transporter permease n=1 Tax=Halalkalibacter suaedae TaxID=2822140 RepID=A0A940WYS1_9BACI|nr:ABC transporter permease [Bacillus suaedae]MBP3951090.1 ABC transporter permease [Bacillus suaedae]
MQSKILSFNRGIITQDIRSVGWIGLVYFICLIFALPLNILLAYTTQTPLDPFIPAESLFHLPFEFVIFLIFTLPVVLAIFLFRYMQAKQPSDFVHSLPITREQLFFQHVAFGTLLLILPVLLTGIILWLLGFFIPAPDLLSIGSIAEWSAITTLFNLFVFYTCVFVGMFTGMSILQGAFTYILFFFPAGILVLIMTNLHFYLYGLSVNTINYESLIPFSRLLEIRFLLLENRMSIGEISIYLVIMIFFLVTSFFVYKIRQVESATSAISFKPLKPIFKYGFTFSTMLVGGAYYGSIQENLGWIIFGYIAASIFGYLVAQMILDKTWRVFSKWKGYVVFIIAMVTLAIIIHFDITGFEKRVPEASNVERVYFAEDNYYWHSRYDEDMYVDNLNPSDFYESPEVIESIRRLHQQIIEDRNVDISHHDPAVQPVSIGYELKDGGLVVREYLVPYRQYAAFYEQILQSDDYRSNQNPVLTIENSKEISHIMIESHRTPGRVTLTEEQQISEFHALLKEDINNQSVEDYLVPVEWDSSINYHLQNGNDNYITWKKSYTEIDNWLETQGLLEEARTTSNDLTHVAVMPLESGEDVHSYLNDSTMETDFDTLPNVIRVDQSDQIDSILKQSEWVQNGASYLVALYYKDDTYPELATISKDKAPEFLTEMFSE